MIDALSNLSPFASQIALVAIGLAFCVSVGIVILANYAVRRAARRRSLAPKTPIKIDGKLHPQTILERADTALNQLRGLAQSFQHIWTGVGEDDISQSFQKTLHILKTYLGDKNFKYQVPWYVLMGAAESGKSTLLNALDLDLPIGRPSYNFSGERPLVDWWFFDQGLILDVHGSLSLGRRTIKYHQANWTHFLNLLNRFRPARPLDGIILTIPADELVGIDALPREKWVERAKSIHARLWSLQTTLAMRVPVYIVITKTDVVPGFSEFVQELPAKSLHQILGWSCPHGVGSYYVPGWVSDIFKTVANNIRHARGMVYAETVARDQTYRDQALSFTNHFEKLRPGIQTILNTVFKETALQESFFLRGVYFSGDNGIPTFDQQQTGASLVPNERLKDGETHVEGSPDTENFQSLTDKPGAQPAFFADLLTDKIFPEGGLAQPIRRIIVSTSRALNFAKVFVATLSVSWAGHLMHARTHLAQVNAQVHPMLEKIERTLDGISRLSTITQRPQLEMFLNEQTEDLIRMMSDVEKMNTTLVGIPGSWSGGFDQRLRQGITIAYDQVILRAIHLELMKKAKKIVSEGLITVPEQTRSQDANPLTLATFKQLQTYISAIEDLEAHVRLYNNLEHSRSIHDLAQIIKFLYQRMPPAQFFEQQQYHARILAHIQDKNISLRPYREHAQMKLRQLVNSFLGETFDIRHMMPLLLKTTDQLDALTQPTTLMNADRLRHILRDLSTFNAILGSAQVRWMEGGRFEPGEAYSKALTAIARSDLFGMTLAEDISTQVDDGFKAYKKKLGTISTTLAGPVLKQEGQTLFMAPAPALSKITDVLQTFLDTGFMAIEPNQRTTIAVPPGKILLWDEIALTSAVGLVEEYNTFITGDLTQVNPELRAIFKVVARNTIREKVINLIARAQTYVDDPADTLSLGRREILVNQVQNFKAVTPLFTKLLGSFEGGGFVLTATGIRELLISQSYMILRKADRILQADGLYNIRGSNFSWWGGDTGLGYQAFGVHDSDGMSQYLAAQRDRITVLATEIVQPIIDFLSLGYLEKTPNDLPLVMMWRRIIKQLNAYANKDPENSVALLEDYIAMDLNDIKLEKCAMEKPFADGDLFLKRRRDLQRLVKTRCLYLANKSLQKTYNKMAFFFNVNLSGRYPFVEKGTKGSPDAKAEDVNDFLKMLSMITPSDERALEVGAKTSIDKEKALHFIRHMQGLRPFLKVALDHSFDQSIPQVDFTVDFRTNKPQENFVNQLVNYSISANNVLISRRSEKNTGAWQSGDAISVSFTFANQSQQAPVDDPETPAMVVDGPQATFQYSGMWGLIRLIQNHQVKMLQNTPGAYRLKFQIPTESRNDSADAKAFSGTNQSLIFFMDMSFALGTTGAPLQGEAYRFPTRAPVVPSLGLE